LWNAIRALEEAGMLLNTMVHHMETSHEAKNGDEVQHLRARPAKHTGSPKRCASSCQSARRCRLPTFSQPVRIRLRDLPYLMFPPSG
jgi:hypothetical protein